MPITRLSLTEFRSYGDLVMRPGPGLNVLTGENGAGKTNILEAVSLLAPGRGLRGAALSEMARRDGMAGFGVSALFEPLPFRSSGSVVPPERPEAAGGSFTRNWVGVGEALGFEVPNSTTEDSPHPNPSPEGEGLVSLGTGTLASAPERRLVRVGGVAAPAAALAEWLSLVWLTPAQDRLFTGPAGERRRFLDRLVLALDATHARDATRYEAAMRQRNRLLAEERADIEWLSALEAAMVQHGLAIAERRANVVDRLGARLAAAPAGPFARAGLALADWHADDFARRLRDSRARDRAAGRTLVGPHRQDLAVTHLEKHLPAASASTGEQKALLIGIVLAHADLVADALDRRPVLLLDEVAAHLDPRRRAALFERLAAGGGQVWLTGTEASLFDNATATRFTVADGRVGRRD